MHLSTVFWQWWGHRSYFTSSVAVLGLFQHRMAQAVGTSFGDSSLFWTCARKASKRWVGFTVWSDVCFSFLVWLEPGFHHKHDFFFFLSCFESCHKMEVVHAQKVSSQKWTCFYFSCNILCTKSKAKVKSYFKVKAMGTASASSMGIKNRFNNSLAYWNNSTPAFVSYKQTQLALKHAFYKLPSLMFLSPPACLVIVCMLFL